MTKRQNIHSDFTEQLLHEWIDRGFTFEKIKSWINNGLVPNDAAFANYLENKGYSAKEILNYNLVSLSIKEKGKEVIKIAEKEEKIEYLLPFDMDGELRKIDFLSKFDLGSFCVLKLIWIKIQVWINLKF